MTVGYFSGFETGDASEISALGTGASIQSAIFRTGGQYALQISPVNGGGTTIAAGMSTTKMILRCYAYFATLPSGSNFPNVFLMEDGQPQPNGVSLKIGYNGNSNRFFVADNSVNSVLGLSSQADGITPIATGRWYRLELAFDEAAGGIVKFWVDGVLDINQSHSSDNTASPLTQIRVVSSTVADNITQIVDDMRVDTGTLTPPGPGTCIARQGKAGTPTYNAWAKNGAATAALCWSNTPFSAGTNCSDAVQNDAQTMLIAPFSSAQIGYGAGFVDSRNGVVNAIKVSMIAKTASAGNTTMRYRAAGTDTDQTKAITTSDAYYQTNLFTDIRGRLDSYEIGVVNAQVATSQTVEDMWMMVEYNNDYGPELDFGPSIGSRVKIIGY